MYELRFKDNSRPAFPITDDICTLGRATENTLVFNTSTVDELHAKLIKKDGVLYIQDYNSQRGCYVNGEKVDYKALSVGDVISIGNVHFEIVHSGHKNPAFPSPMKENPIFSAHTASDWQLLSDSCWLPDKVFELKGNSSLLGRGKDCDIVIPGTHLSRNHAILLKHEDHLILKDLDSAHGSFVNDIKVDDEHIVKAGDRLRFDVYSFRVQGPAPGRRSDAAEISGFTRIPNANIEDTLQNIEALRSQEYQQKEWITKPTSHGNRYHEVPNNRQHLGTMFWVSVVLGVSVLCILGYLMTNP